MLTLLIVEGNTPETNRRIRALGGRLQSELFETLLHAAGDVRTQVVHAADVSVPLPDEEALSRYAGIVWTGSALNLRADDPAGMRQVELAQRGLRSGAFMYGSCWGLQVVAAAVGGQVVPNPRGREIGVARDIRPTEAGRRHPLLDGRPEQFDALAVHRDIIAAVPETNLTVLARNEISPIQAAELRWGNGRFWGVQYHPEYDFHDLAAAFRRYASALVAEDLFPDLDAVETEARLCEAVATTGRVPETDVPEPASAPPRGGTQPPSPAGAAALVRWGIDPALANPEFRTLEVQNWLAALRERRETYRRPAPQ